MPTKNFRVNVYHVELAEDDDNTPTPFPEAVLNASRESLAEREKKIGGKGRRLDDWHLIGDVLSLHLVTFQYEGDGRVREGQPTSAFVMAPDEHFAPETAMLYDAANDLAFVESGKGSMGSATIARYFEKFADKGTFYTLTPVADQTAAARARNHTTIRKLKMGMFLGPITDTDREAGIDPVKAFAADYGAERITIEISSGRSRDRSLGQQAVRNLIDLFTRSASQMPPLTKLEVTGREHDDEPLEIIDLLQQRERHQSTLEIDNGSRKVPHETRWRALRGIRNNLLQGS